MTAGLALTLLFLAAPSDAARTGRDLVDVEAATDAFFACYEPRLADDPVIRTPIGERVPFERLDNDVSNAAFEACIDEMNRAGKAVRAFASGRKGLRPDWNRWFGVSVIRQRYLFYQSRGAIGLAQRRQMRPFMRCVADKLAGAEPGADPAQACAALRFHFPPDGPGAGIERLASSYQDRFAREAAAFLAGEDPLAVADRELRAASQGGAE